jgi:type I site-specific restriction endonuclease
VDIARGISLGHFTKRIIAAFVTPGGGKTLMAALFATVLLKLGIIDQVLFVVPRDTLREQGREDFTNGERGLTYFLTEHGLRSKQSPKQLRFHNVFAGYIVTYQELAPHKSAFLKWMKGKRVLVIVDECHHVTTNPSIDSGDDASWHRALAPIISAAKIALLMSGTMERDNASERISFVGYDGGLPVCDIEYTRADAIRDGAIIEAEFKCTDALVHLERDGMVTDHVLSTARGRMASTVLSKTLDHETAYPQDVVAAAIDDFLDYRENHNSKAKLIVIAKGQKAAQAIHLDLVRQRPHLGVELAITLEGTKAKKAVSRFRHQPDSRVLVTVQMAYEGLDVKSCTHIVCLTVFRSKPWLEQAFARATRFDPNCGLKVDEQRATILVPDDDKMRRVISAIQEEQRQALADRGIGHGVPPRRGKSSFASLGAEATDVRLTGERHYSKDESAIIARVEREYPFTKKHSIEHKIQLAIGFGWWGNHEAAE